MSTSPNFIYEYPSQKSTEASDIMSNILRVSHKDEGAAILLMALTLDLIKSPRTVSNNWTSGASKHQYLEDTINLTREIFKELDQFGVVITLFSKKHRMAYRRLSRAQKETHKTARLDFVKLYPDQARVLENYANNTIASFPEDFFAQL